MSGKACGLCLRDECERCHEANCACCGAGALLFPQLSHDDDYEWDERDGPVTL